MTDRHIAYTVTLEAPVRSDDAEHILNAIRMIKGVAAVDPVVADASQLYAVQRVHDGFYHDLRVWAADWFVKARGG